MNRRSPTAITAILIGLLSLCVSDLTGQPSYTGSKREFRGVWVATVLNYDWPLSPTMTTQQQKDSLLVLFDTFVSARMNAVVLQIRPECDAFYESSIEPWSYWLTGAQGVAPNPFYDPLEFAITEAHNRGMELHAWFNPYRAYRQDNTYARSPGHIVETHPEWVITCPDGYKLLDPGLPEVRDYVVRIVMDVCRRYAIDGVHFDDYFYPYPEHSFSTQDSATWAAYPRGFTWANVAGWRRDNVNLLIRQVYDSVQAVKPGVKFGVSPFGIWKAGTPPGISGTSAYDVIFCDALAWLQGSYIDYIVPQLYWQFGGGQDYGTLQPWWGGQRNGRHFYTGNAAYRIKQNNWPAAEITNQIRFNQTNQLAQGSVLFQASNLRRDDGGLLTQLQSDLFRFPALIPVMDWKETIPPNAPQNLQISFNSSRGAYELQWQEPAAASDGDTAARYVVYRVRGSSVGPGDADVPRNMVMLSGTTLAVPPARIDTFDVQYSFAVSALDKNNNESPLTPVVHVAAPLPVPQLTSPADGSQTFGRTDSLVWTPVPGATLYRIQVDTSGMFQAGEMIVNREIEDHACAPPDVKGAQTYYWRVIAGSQVAESPLSAVRSFSPAWPLRSTLLTPNAATNVSRTPFFRWTRAGGTSFRVRVIDNGTRLTVLDTTVTDSSFTSTTVLAASKIFGWTVLPHNAYGDGELSEEARFRTGTEIVAVGESGTVPDRFLLEQNYPNPFNPTTVVSYQLPVVSNVRLAIYDLLGREVAALVNEKKGPGIYEVMFDARGLPSGVFFCRLSAMPVAGGEAGGPSQGHGAGFVQTRKMVLLR